jgi:hypothetical protein
LGRGLNKREVATLTFARDARKVVRAASGTNMAFPRVLFGISAVQKNQVQHIFCPSLSHVGLA